jgi:hypothetical protein
MLFWTLFYGSISLNNVTRVKKILKNRRRADSQNFASLSPWGGNFFRVWVRALSLWITAITVYYWMRIKYSKIR